MTPRYAGSTRLSFLLTPRGLEQRIRHNFRGPITKAQSALREAHHVSGCPSWSLFTQLTADCLSHRSFGDRRLRRSRRFQRFLGRNFQPRVWGYYEGSLAVHTLVLNRERPASL